MGTREQLIKARLGMMALASELKNIAKACKLAGVSRSHFYEIKRAYEIFGKEGLAPRIRRKPNMPNRTPVPIEDEILLKTHANPTVSYTRLAGHMTLEGFSVTPAMVRYAWQRHGLSTRAARLRWVKRRNGQVGGSKVEDGPNKLDKVRAEACVPATTAPSSMSIGGAV
jgi:Helix-turn-helix domain